MESDSDISELQEEEIENERGIDLEDIVWRDSDIETDHFSPHGPDWQADEDIFRA